MFLTMFNVLFIFYCFKSVAIWTQQVQVLNFIICHISISVVYIQKSFCIVS